MHQSQVNFAAFAAAFVCPPPAVNDAAFAVTAPAVSGQGADAIRVFTPARILSEVNVAGGWRGDWYIDWQSVGGCLDAPEFVPAGGTVALACADGRTVADGYCVRAGVFDA